MIFYRITIRSIEWAKLILLCLIMAICACFYKGFAKFSINVLFTSPFEGAEEKIIKEIYSKIRRFSSLFGGTTYEEKELSHQISKSSAHEHSAALNLIVTTKSFGFTSENI